MTERPRNLIPRSIVALPLLDQAPTERADAARNRLRILDAANRIVADRGAETLSLDEVARAAGVGVGTVYRRFGDRAGLLYALIDERERQFQVAFMEGPPPLGPGAPAADRLRAFLHALLDRIEEQRELLVGIEANVPVGWFNQGPHLVRQVHVVGLLTQIRPAGDPHYLTDVLLAALSPSLIQHQREVRGLSADQIKAGLDTLLECLTRGHDQRRR